MLRGPQSLSIQVVAADRVDQSDEAGRTGDDLEKVVTIIRQGRDLIVWRQRP